MDQSSSQPAPAASCQQPVPDVWPGAFGIYKYSRDAVRRVLWPLVGAGAVFFAVFIGISLSLPHNLADSTPLYILVNILVNLIVNFFVIVMVRILLQGVRGNSVSSEHLFDGNMPMMIVKLYLVDLIVAILTPLIIFPLIFPF